MIYSRSEIVADGRLEWDENVGYVIWNDGDEIPVAELLKPFIGHAVNFTLCSDDSNLISKRIGDLSG